MKRPDLRGTARKRHDTIRVTTATERGSSGAGDGTTRTHVAGDAQAAHQVSGSGDPRHQLPTDVVLETHFKLEAYKRLIVGAAVFLHGSGAADASAQTTMSLTTNPNAILNVEHTLNGNYDSLVTFCSNRTLAFSQ